MSNFPKRNYSRRRRYRRRYRKGKYLNRAQKAQVKKIVQVQTSFTIEKKFHDVTFEAQQVQLTPVITDLTAISAGITKTTRVSLECTLKSLMYRFQFTLADTTNFVRWVLFQWYPDSSLTAPVWDDLFSYSTGGTPNNQYELMSPLAINEATRVNFKILKNEMFNLDEDNPQQLFSGFIKKGFRRSLNFNTSAQTGTNHIYLLVVSDSGVVPHVQFDGVTRACFIDP